MPSSYKTQRGWFGYADAALLSGAIATIGFVAVFHVDYWYVAELGLWLKGTLLVLLAAIAVALYVRRRMGLRHVGGVFLSRGARASLSGVIAFALIALTVIGGFFVPDFDCLCGAEDLEERRDSLFEGDKKLQEDLQEKRDALTKALKKEEERDAELERLEKIVESFPALSLAFQRRAIDLADGNQALPTRDMIEEWSQELERIRAKKLVDETVSRSLDGAKDDLATGDAENSRRTLGLQTLETRDPGYEPVPRLRDQFKYCGDDRAIKKTVTRNQLAANLLSVTTALGQLEGVQEAVRAIVDEAEIPQAPEITYPLSRDLPSETGAALARFRDVSNRAVQEYEQTWTFLAATVQKGEFALGLEGLDIFRVIRGDEAGALASVVALTMIEQRAQQWLSSASIDLPASGEAATVNRLLTDLEAKYIGWWTIVLGPDQEHADFPVGEVQSWAEKLDRLLLAMQSDQEWRRLGQWNRDAVNRSAEAIIQDLLENQAHDLNHADIKDRLNNLNGDRKKALELAGRIGLLIQKIEEFAGKNPGVTFKESCSPDILAKDLDGCVLALSLAQQQFEADVVGLVVRYLASQAGTSTGEEPSPESLKQPVLDLVSAYVGQIGQVMSGRQEEPRFVGLVELQKRAEDPFDTEVKGWVDAKKAIPIELAALFPPLILADAFGLKFGTKKEQRRLFSAWQGLVGNKEIGKVVDDLAKMNASERAKMIEIAGKEATERLDDLAESVGLPNKDQLSDFFLAVDVLKAWKEQHTDPFSVAKSRRGPVRNLITDTLQRNPQDKLRISLLAQAGCQSDVQAIRRWVERG